MLYSRFQLGGGEAIKFSKLSEYIHNENYFDYIFESH